MPIRPARPATSLRRARGAVRRGLAPRLALLAALAAALAAPLAAHAAFPGANGLIAFSRTAGSDSEIAVVRSDGSGLRELTRNRVSDVEPAWSADGRRIAFSSNRERPLDWDIWVMRADGSGVRRVTSHRAADRDPTWSPDGTRLAFSSDRDRGDVDIWVVPAGGGQATRLAGARGLDVDPAWSPDGTRVVFASDRDGGNFDLWVVNADGSGETRLTGGPGMDLSPSWSPDGRNVVFTRLPPGGGDGDVRIVRADLSGAPLTRRRGDDLAPAFAPDGKRVVFQGDRRCQLVCPFAVWVMDADGSSRVRVTGRRGSTVRSLTPDWQPVVGDLRLTAVAPIEAVVGADLELRLDVANRGPGPAIDAVAALALPAGLPIVAAAAGRAACAVADGAVTCPLGRIRPGQAVAVSLVVRPAVAEALGATATVGARSADRRPGDERADIAVSVVDPAAPPA
ncbi:MAG: hypothetical protein R3C15_05255 [Thermoleophilia bacterium]